MNIVSLLNQTVTLWSGRTEDGTGGATFAAPVQLAGRWQDKVERFLSASGKEEVSQAVIYLQEPVVAGGYLYLGTSAATDPMTVEGAKEIRSVGKSPSLDASQTLVKVWL